MRIYFNDGPLYDIPIPESSIIIDAADGYSTNISDIERLKEVEDISIFTNQILALQNDFCWNDKTNKPDVFIYDKSEKKWKHITTLTDRELRFSHNLYIMYTKGEFR